MRNGIDYVVEQLCGRWPFPVQGTAPLYPSEIMGPTRAILQQLRLVKRATYLELRDSTGASGTNTLSVLKRLVARGQVRVLRRKRGSTPALYGIVELDMRLGK